MDFLEAGTHVSRCSVLPMANIDDCCINSERFASAKRANVGRLRSQNIDGVRINTS